MDKRQEQIAAAKVRQKEDALARSSQSVRRTSSSSTDNTQSEVTQKPPTLYQVPKINVPADLHEFARLIHSELSKIAGSQSVLLSMWEKLDDNDPEKLMAQITAQVRIQLKREIYAELAELNAGIVVPVVIE